MSANQRSVRPAVESLEDRCVPARFTVTTLADGVGVPGTTLREAVLRSNSTPSASDTIVFKPALKGTIKLTSEIAITDGVRINGPGANLLKISGQDAARIFSINDGDGVISSMKVTIRGLTLQRGSAVQGGAIRNESDDVTLSQCTLRGNAATGEGGAYYANQGRLTIERCKFLGNRSILVHGGAVKVTGVLVARDSQFSGNQAEVNGGAIWAFGASTTLRRCKITNNTVQVSDGGGVACNGGTLAIRQSTISGNFAWDTGGGLNLVDVAANISTSTISGNSAGQFGGGLFSLTLTKLSLRSSTVSGNTAGASGGGLFISSAASTHVIQLSTIAHNHASAQGGGIFADRDVTLFSTIVARNSATAGGADLRNNHDFSADFCLIQNADPAFAAIVETSAGSNVTGQSARLSPLRRHGGPTRTHALLPGSPALNAGANTSPAEKLDQRGATFKRVKGGHIDIGAFER